ncbi:PREDICTED: E3 ubiquitin-protein ligase RNF4-like [Branchiostoma belcheri]|uniref:E3 ubiquitin-protein ligase RNF4-like n=1 Tax=Branchiostoma belcheri TaxID=7741 RepID=A0A6P4Z5T7_BRABE|nr:PREDICTED: E3 ubiquitin-protein ligase RNF4-like [Branchiostoma belcheri]
MSLRRRSLRLRSGLREERRRMPRMRRTRGVGRGVGSQQEPIDVEDAPAIVDLTSDHHDADDDVVVCQADDEVVDLTSPHHAQPNNSMLPVYLNGRRHPQQRNLDAEVLVSDDEVTIESERLPAPRLLDLFRDEDPGPSTSASSPPKTISCPVCLDDAKQISVTGRRLMSTVCGHVFCETCLKEALQTQKKCPNCRKKLTVKQIHPIFI